MLKTYLISISLTRREIGVAVFRGTEVEYCSHRHLASEEHIAHRSISGLIAQLQDRYPAEAAVVLRADPSTRAGAQERTAFAELESLGVPVTAASSTDLLHAYAEPALRSKAQLRSVARSIWPAMADSKDGV